jgi:hypothetical protein
MRLMQTTTAAVVFLSSIAPTLAVTCKDDISTIERRLNSVGAEKVTGTKPPGGAVSAGSEKALDKQPSGAPSDPSVKPSASGVSEAKALLEKARTQDKAGDEKGCQETMTKVKQTAGALP